MLDSQQIDDAIIVNGNYQNQSEWINSLSPQMVRQPILLLTSNGDDIATPYQMTLMYNKFSSDSIIHMGGVYHADQNDVFLSITDSGFHATVPFHSQTMEEILRFVNPLLEQPLEMTALPSALLPDMRRRFPSASSTALRLSKPPCACPLPSVCPGWVRWQVCWAAGSFISFLRRQSG